MPCGYNYIIMMTTQKVHEVLEIRSNPANACKYTNVLSYYNFPQQNSHDRWTSRFYSLEVICNVSSNKFGENLEKVVLLIM